MPQGKRTPPSADSLNSLDKTPKNVRQTGKKSTKVESVSKRKEPLPVAVGAAPEAPVPIRQGVATKMRVKRLNESLGKQVATGLYRRSFKNVTQRKSSFVESIRSRIELLRKERKRQTHTPLIFRLKARRHAPVFFSWEDVKEVLLEQKKEAARASRQSQAKKHKAYSDTSLLDTDVSTLHDEQDLSQSSEQTPARPPRVFGAASALDILGFNPQEGYRRGSAQEEIKRVPSKLMPFYRALIRLREHVEVELNIHQGESIKRSLNEELGDSKKLDQGDTESVTRDMSLTMVSSNQEMLYEIEEAIKRILNNRYGICEITQKPINKDRLMAVPFTRYSLEGQHQVEERRSRIRQEQRSGLLFSEIGEEDSGYSADREYADED